MAQMGNIHQMPDLTKWIAMGLHLVATGGAATLLDLLYLCI
jgi:hypothetical protein